MTILRFPTKAEQDVRAGLLKALDEHAWIGLVFLWQGATVQEGARRNGPFMRFNIRSSIVGCGLTELTACLIFGGVPFDVWVPYENVVLLVEPQSGELLASFMRPEPGNVCETFDGECRWGP